MHGGRSRDASLVGRALGEFVVREPLSSGGFGMVFRAEQPALAREAVIKVLHTRLLASETVVQRFLREARLASRLDHPYAAHIYAFGAEPDGVLWIAMELVRGTPLDELLKAQGPIPLARFAPLLDRICEVVHTAHEQGIVHRDLKPGNVMVLSRAGRLLPKLLDLGIAMLDGSIPGESAPAPGRRAAAAAAGDGSLGMASTMVVAAEPSRGRVPAADGPADTGGRLTQAGATMGSPLYMAPEQWFDATTVDARTDLYALGILSYEALTGRPPFSGSTELEISRAHALAPPPPLGDGLPRALDKVLARALAKDPADRFATALELAAAFRAASGIGAEPAALPRLNDALRMAAMAGAPRPIALAIDALDAARNAHQERDAVWQVVRTATRMLGVIAMAAHSHVRADPQRTDPAIEDGLRGLRGRALSDGGWVELARDLVRPFSNLRDAHPVPELVEFLGGESSAVLDQLFELRAAAEEAGVGSEEQVRDLLDRALPLLATLLGRLSFLHDYPLVVALDGRAEEWTGTRRFERPARAAASALGEGRPALLDAEGTPVVSLWPFVQVRETVPGAGPALFFFEGKGRRGARLVALPDAFECEDEELWESLGAILGDTGERAGSTTHEEECPFPGLAAFTAADAHHFVGRERETELFLNRLRTTPLLAVVGPSGAGKSSFVQAGVVPQLPDGWRAEIVRPGPAPLVSLEARLVAMGLDAGGLRDELEGHPGALASGLRAHAAAHRCTLVLVIDQLEELFTLCEDPDERELYAHAVVRAARSAEDPVRVILTLRDDFLLPAEAITALRSRLGQSLHLLTTPAASDLRRILVEPIRRAGYEFDDPALPDEMVESVSGAPGALALLSFTAARLWELRDRRFRQIGHRAYRTLGGVGGALAQHAESVLQGMTAEEQRLVRECFRHAVTAQGTRAVLGRSELDEVLGGGPNARSVVEKLVAARLLVVSETDTGERVEIAHEALLVAWPRLVTWRREDAEGARLRDQLRAAARQWEERGKPNGLLWRGDALVEYRLWRARYPGLLTASELAFATASRAEAARGRRVRRVAAAVAAAVLVAGALALVWANRRTEAQRQAAEASAGEARSRLNELRFQQARQAHLSGNSLEALTYAEDALRTTEPDPAMRYLVAAAMRTLDAQVHTFRPRAGLVPVARFLMDGTRVATGGQDGSPMIWDAASGKALRTLGEAPDADSLAVSPDGLFLAAGSTDGPVAVWRISSGAVVARMMKHEARVTCLRFAADGSALLSGSLDRTAHLWRLPSGEEAAEIRVDDGSIQSCDLDPAGRWIMTASERVRLWDPAGGRLLRELDERRPDTMARLSPDGSTVLVFAPAHDTPSLWDAATGRSIARLRGHTVGVTAADFSADGRFIVTAGLDQTVKLWDAHDGTLRLSFPHPANPIAVAFDPSGSRVATSSGDLRMRIWEVGEGRLLAATEGQLDLVDSLEFSPDGALVLSASRDGTARLWTSATAGMARRLPAPAPDRYRAATLSHDGRFILSYTESGVAAVWSAAGGDPVARFEQYRVDPDRTPFASSIGLRAIPSLDATGRLAALPVGDAVAVVDVASQRELFRLEHEQRATCTRFSPDGRWIATASTDGAVRIWDRQRGALRHDLAGHASRVWAVDFSPDGALLASGDLFGELFVWDLASGEKLYSVKAYLRGLLGVSFSPDGERIATAGMSRQIKIWGAREPRLLATLEATGSAMAVAYAPDGDRLVSIDGGGQATVWDPTRAQPLDRIGIGGAQGSWVEVSADSRRALLTNGSVELWNIAPRDEDRARLLERLRRLLPYTLEGERIMRKPSQ